MEGSGRRLRVELRRHGYAILLAATLSLVATAVPASVEPARTRNPTHSHQERRLVPDVRQIPPIPPLSPEPTDAEISRVRAFGEPLVPIGAATAQENRDLAEALVTFVRQRNPEGVSPLLGFLEEHPRSAWRASLLTNLGFLYRRTGHISKALATWEAAWRASKDADSSLGHAVADRAVSELAALYAGLGNCQRLEALLREIQGRDVRGSAQERIAAARQGLGLMRETPERAFACGPRALERILQQEAPASRAGETFDMRATASVPLGTTLVSLKALANALGLRMQMAKRVAGAPLLVPSVVQWEAGPFAALLAQQDGRYLLYDPSLSEELWLTAKALDEEASGYFLVPEGSLPPGWRAVAPEEGERVWYPMPSLLSDRQGSPRDEGLR